MIAHNPVRSSGQAELLYPAPTLGEDVQAHERIRMTNTSRWEPSRNLAPHAAPPQVVALAATAQYRPPQVAHCVTKSAQGRAAPGHSVIAEAAQGLYFTAQYPACTSPCQCFDAAFASGFA